MTEKEIADLQAKADVLTKKIEAKKAAKASEEKLKNIGNNVVEATGRGIGLAFDTTGGTTRNAAAGLIGKSREDDLKRLLQGNAPSTAEILRREGGMFPAMEPGILNTAIGEAGDILVDVGNLAPGAIVPLTAGKVAGKLPKLGKYLKEALESKFLQKPITAAAENIGAPIAGLVSGVPTDVIRTYPKLMKPTEEILSGGDAAMMQAADDLGRSITVGVQGAKKEAGSLLNEAAGGIDNLNIAGMKTKWKNYIKGLEQQEALTGSGAQTQRIADAKDSYRQLFGENVSEAIPPVSTGVFDSFGNPIMKESPNKIISKEIPDVVSGKDLLDIQQFSKNISDYGPKGLSEQSGKTRIDSELSSMGKQTYNEGNELLDKLSEGLSSEAKNKYRIAMNKQRVLASGSRGGSESLALARNLGTKAKTAQRVALQGIEGDVLDQAQALRNASMFTDVPWTPMSGNGTTSTTRTITNALAGGAIGLKTGDPYMGLALGLATGPAALHQGLKYGTKAGNLLGKIPGAERLSKKAQQEIIWNDLARSLLVPNEEQK